MKFEYDGKENGRECVAFIDEDGVLYIKTDEGSTLLYGGSESPNHGSNEDWDYGLSRATHKFYPGDKITITF